MESPSAYTVALRMLARRELSTAQVRERLARREFNAAEIEDAVSRLTATGALDDLRVARAVARTRANIRRQGRNRIVRELAVIGIPREIAERVLAEVFGELDEDALLEQALVRRLRGSMTLDDPAVRRRLVAALVRQGFVPGAVMRTMRRVRQKQ